MFWIHLTLLLLCIQTKCLQLSVPSSATVGQPVTMSWTKDQNDPSDFKIVFAPPSVLNGKDLQDINTLASVSSHDPSGTVTASFPSGGTFVVGAIKENFFPISSIKNPPQIQVNQPAAPPGTPGSQPSAAGPSAFVTPNSLQSTSASTSEHGVSSSTTTTGSTRDTTGSTTVTDGATPASDDGRIGQTSSSSLASTSSLPRSLSTSTPAMTASVIPPSPPVETTSNSKSNVPAIVGGVLGTIIFLLLLFLLVFFLRRRLRRRRNTTFSSERMVRKPGSPLWFENMVAKQRAKVDDVSTTTISTSPDLDTVEDLPYADVMSMRTETVTVVSASTDTPSVLPPGFSYPTIITTPASPEPTILYAPRTGKPLPFLPPS